MVRNMRRPKERTKAPAILIVDDNEFMRTAIRHLIVKSRPEWHVCGEAGNGEQAVKSAKALRPDVIILDESMPIVSGLQAATKIGKLGLRSRIILLTAFEEKDLAVQPTPLPYIYVDKARAGYDLVPAIATLIGEKEPSASGNPPPTQPADATLSNRLG
jgi:DNA-binding NarL/FixJ family response regulator